MNNRQANLLAEVVRLHASTAEPVGSKLLVEKTGLDVSSATVRNELAALEEEGYIAQPHTSAGRVPTAKGYQYYVEHFLQEAPLATEEQQVIADLAQRFAQEQGLLLRSLAKAVAQFSQHAALVGFGPHDVYYTGLSYLFAQPEFSQSDQVCQLSRVVDHLDEVMSRVFDQVSDGVDVWIGQQNPFGSACSVVITRYGQSAQYGVFGLLGPLRQDYDRAFSYVSTVKRSLS